MSALTVARLREVLAYGRDTGLFHWRSTNRQAGSRRDADRSVRIGIDGVRYRAHRLAWLHVHGVWPSQQIDHINGDPSDNRLANLRDVSQAVNLQNLVRPHRGNRSGFLGVDFHNGRFRARILVAGKEKWIGGFASPELAHAAYVQAKREHHEGNTL